MTEAVVNRNMGKAPWPMHVVVIGGGRWSRVLVQVLCEIVPATTSISMHSSRGAGANNSWLIEQGLIDRVRVSSDPPELKGESSTAVIVANAAQDHELAVELALLSKRPVLVEKPMALSAAAANRLIELARAHRVRLATAHVFLFARYLHNFSKHVASSGRILSLRIEWSDPQTESRYGERKQFDPNIPIFMDWLPHITSILDFLLPECAQQCEHLQFSKGGSDLTLTLKMNDVQCLVRLTRNSDQRRRLFEIDTEQGLVRLDSSTEPGTITKNAKLMCADPEWSNGSRPVAMMLSAFLLWAAGGQFDIRLDPVVGLRATEVTDQAAKLYNSARIRWLSEICAIDSTCAHDLRYALNEISLCKGTLPDALKFHIVRLEQIISQMPSEGAS